MADQLSLYDVTIPLLVRALTTLSGLLKKAETYAEANKVPLEDFTVARLAPDMAPFPFQIRTACDTAKFLAVRIGGIENVPMADDETTFPQLHDRITRTVDFLNHVKREDIDGKENIEVLFRGHKFTGFSYATTFAIPNFYFHFVAAYAILRSKGVPIGKLDYLGVSEGS
jgi:uncharacterized protein